MAFSPQEFNYLPFVRPVLKSLAVSIDERFIHEALPHLCSTLNLEQFKNTLCRLGIVTAQKKCRLNQLSVRKTPALFISAKNAYLITGWDQNDLKALDLQTQENFTLKSSFFHRGTLLTFSFNETMGFQGGKSWSKQLFKRFKPYYAQWGLLGFMTSLLSLSGPLYIKAVYELAVPIESTKTLLYLTAGSLLAIVFHYILHLMKGHSIAYLGARVQTILSQVILEKILSLPVPMVEGSSVGAQITKLRQFDGLRDIFSQSLAQLVLEIPFILVFFITLFILAGPIVTVPFLLAVVFLGVGLYWIDDIREKTQKSTFASQRRQAFLVESINSLSTLKNLNLEDLWLKRFQSFVVDKSKATSDLEKLTAFLMSISQTLMKIAAVTTIIWSTIRVIEGQLAVSSLVAIVLLVWRCLAPIQALFTTMTQFDSLKMIFIQLNNLMSLPGEIRFKNSFTLPNVQGLIRLQNVTFTYPNDVNPSLVDVSLEARPGELVGVMGNNGSGKTTLAKLLLGFYFPQTGSMTLDTLEFSHFDAVRLRQKIAYVPNLHHFFHGTINQNLRFNRPTATQEDIYNALELAGVLQDVLALPNGAETLLSHDSLQMLSFGFRQKLNLARAYLKDSNILILDEPATGLDDKSDEWLKKTLLSFQGKKTVIIISHRPSLINLTSRVLVLENGQMVAFGPREKVMEYIKRKVA